MEEENSEGGVESVAADSTPVASDPVNEVQTESADSTSSSTPSEEESNPYASFDWDSWDGSHKSFPDSVQPWAERVYNQREDWVNDQISTSEGELDRLRNLYETLVSGHDDPRLSEFESKVTSWEQKYKELEDKHSASLEEHTTYKSSIDAAIETEADAYADRFATKHAAIFNDADKSNMFSNLVEEGWDFEIVPELMSLNEDEINSARTAKKDGVPDRYAIQLAVRSARSKPDPRPGARITAGATTPSVTPNQVKSDFASAKSFDDVRTIAARTALKRHSGGRR